MEREIIEGFMHGVGFAILWLMGMFAIPLSVMILYGFATQFRDEEIAWAVFITTLVFYWIGTSLLLLSA